MAWALYNAQGALQSTDVPTSSVMTMFNVKDFGAKGDGTTNDAVAIQAAINAAGAAGVSGRGVDVYFPAGVYAHGSAIAVPFNNVMLRGAGWQSTVLYYTAGTGDQLQIGNGTSKAGCGLMNMSVWASGAKTTGASINVNAMNDCLIQNFVINNCFQGILVQGTSIKVWIDQGEINNIHVADGEGIRVTNGAAGDTYISNIVMSNTPASKPLYGIHVDQTGHLSILRCNVTSCVKGLFVNPTTGQDVSYLFIDHSLFDSCGSHAAHFAPLGSATGRVRSVICVNSWFSGTTATGSGIELSIASSAILDGISFIGCRVLNNYNHGVTLGSGPVNVSFTDSTIAGNGAQTVNTYDGISIAAGASNISILNCGICQQGTAGNQQRYAINIAAGASANIQIISNQTWVNGTAGNQGGGINSGVLTGGGNSIAFNIPGVNTGMDTATVAASTAINTTETVISAALRMGAYALRPGQTIRFTLCGSCTVSTAAAVPTIRVRMGTAGTTSDGAIMTFTMPTSGGVGTSVFKVVISLTCRTIGASGTFEAEMVVNQASATLGLIALNSTALRGTAATGNTTANNYINVTYQAASANVTCTFQQVITEIAVS